MPSDLIILAFVCWRFFGIYVYVGIDKLNEGRKKLAAAAAAAAGGAEAGAGAGAVIYKGSQLDGKG